MRTLILLCVVLASGCGESPTAPDEQPTTIEWPVREWRDTVIYWIPGDTINKR